MNLTLFFSLLIYFGVFPSLGFSQEYYTVKNGESLSSILFKNGISPIYGPKGYLKKTIELNQNLIDHLGNFILPNLKIRLPTVAVSISQQVPLKVGHKIDELRKPSSLPSLPPPTVQDSNHKTFSVFSLSPSLSFLNIEGADQNSHTKGNILSDALTGIKLKWAQVWTDRLSTYLDYDYMQLKLHAPINSKMENSEKYIMSFGGGLKYDFYHSLSLNFGLEAREEIFYRAKEILYLKVEKATTNSFSLDVSSKLFSISKLSTSAGLGVKYSTPLELVAIKSKSALGYESFVSISHTEDKFQVTGKLSYFTQKRAIENVEFKTNEISSSISLDWSYGK